MMISQWPGPYIVTIQNYLSNKDVFALAVYYHTTYQVDRHSALTDLRLGVPSPTISVLILILEPILYGFKCFLAT